MTDDKPDARYIGLDEAAILTGVSRRQLERYIAAAEHPLPARRHVTGPTRGRVLIWRPDLLAWMEQAFPVLPAKPVMAKASLEAKVADAVASIRGSRR